MQDQQTPTQAEVYDRGWSGPENSPGMEEEFRRVRQLNKPRHLSRLAQNRRRRERFAKGFRADRDRRNASSVKTLRTQPRPRGGRPTVKGASTRASARSGDSGSDDEPEPADDGERVARLCQACGEDISDRRRDAQTCGGACRTKKYRKPSPETPRNTCRDRGDASNPVLDEVLATCGGWPNESRADRARLIRHAANLGIALSDTQAGCLIDGSYRRSPREKLIQIAAAVREKQRADRESELGELVDLETFRRRHARFVNSLPVAYSRVAA
jgi:hypothetical protein